MNILKGIMIRRDRTTKLTNSLMDSPMPDGRFPSVFAGSMSFGREGSIRSFSIVIRIPCLTQADMIIKMQESLKKIIAFRRLAFRKKISQNLLCLSHSHKPIAKRYKLIPMNYLIVGLGN